MHRARCWEGRRNVFSAWSDGGAQTHEYIAPASPQSLSATFNLNPVAPGLVAAYSFNEGSGTQVGDASGTGHVGAISGATWSTQGKFGGALSFDGVNDWVTVASTPLLNLTTGMTLEAWVFPTATTGTRDILIKEGSNVDIYNLYGRNWQGLPETNVFVGGANRTAPGTALAANVWTHLAGTFDGNTLRLFINGAQVASAAVSGAVSTSTGALRIGGNSLWGESFQGRIDEIRVYNRALNQSEIQADMNLPVGPAAPDTTPPLRSNGLPTGTIAAGPPPAVLSLTTDENAVCRYSPTPGVAFDAMAGTFATTGATAHSTSVDESTSAGTFAFYVRCRDAAGNANPDEFTIAFTTVYMTTVSVFPTGAAVVTGTLSSGTAVNLAADDNVYYFRQLHDHRYTNRGLVRLVHRDPQEPHAAAGELQGQQFQKLHADRGDLAVVDEHVGSARLSFGRHNRDCRQQSRGHGSAGGVCGWHGRQRRGSSADSVSNDGQPHQPRRHHECDLRGGFRPTAA